MRLKSLLFVALLILGFSAAGAWLPARSPGETGPRAVLDALLAVGLASLVILVATATGWKIMHRLQLEGLGGLDRFIFAAPIGLGITAYGVLALGLLGLLEAWALGAWLFLLAAYGLAEMEEIWRRLLAWLRYGIKSLHSWKPGAIALGAVIGLLALMTFLQALTPPWDADGLLYHLQGPRLFLSSGRIAPLPQNWLTYYPSTIEMLFLLGQGWGSEVFAKLLNFAFAVILLLATYSLGRRFLGSMGGWLSAAILLGIPILPIWASIAYIDLAWASLEFLSVGAALIWFSERKPAWLVLSGILMGFALGSKYLALGGGLALVLWVIWNSRKEGWRAILVNGLLFGGTALLVCSPWYIKNLLWTGNPIYPLLLPPQEWSAERVALWTDYMRGFGTGQGLLDYLLLPVNLYLRYERFGTFMGSIEVPSFLFLLVIFYPLAGRTRLMDALCGLLVLRFVVWAAGAQQTRYLLPLFPALSLLTAHVFIGLTGRLRNARLGRVAGYGLVLGMCAATFVYAVLFFAAVRPLGVIAGFESKASFLRRLVGDYPVMQFIQSELSPGDRVLMLWDGRGYYCDERCLPDIDHAQWTEIAWDATQAHPVAAELRQRSVTHLLFSEPDADFILQHDPSEKHRRAASFFVHQFVPECTRPVYRDELVTLYELTCP